jgi:hypothetical protein
MSDDFLFHGRSPTDWVDGGTSGHRYTVYFADVPSEAQRHDVAAMFEGLLARGPATSGSPWSWVDRWASFTVGERWRADAAFFTRMGEMFGALHAIAPLVQVRYSNAIGPATPQILNAPAAGWEVDAAFEASRKELIREAIRAEGVRLAADALAGEIALVPMTIDVPPPKSAPRTSVVFGAHDTIAVGRSGRIVSASHGESGRLAFVDDADVLRVVELPELSAIRTFAVGDDGTRALVAAKPASPGPDALYDVTLAGKCRKVWTSPAGTIHGVVQVGDRAFVLTDKKLHWVKLLTGEEIASVAAGGMTLRSLRGGSILIAYHASNKLFVVSAAADKLKLLAKLSTQGSCTIVEMPDAIHAFVQAGGTTSGFELVNVDAAYRALADKTKKKN